MLVPSHRGRLILWQVLGITDSFIFHVISILQARAWRPTPNVGKVKDATEYLRPRELRAQQAQ
jgi:hypothetical protein